MTTPQHPAPPQNAPQNAPQAAPLPSVPQQPAAAPRPLWPGQEAPSGYVSPIPVRKPTLADAIVAEWTKIRSLRSTMWTLAALLLCVVGLGVLIAVVINAVSTGAHAEGTGSVLILGLYGVLLGSICVITLGALTTSSEYGTGLIRTTLAACPDRGRLLAAKAIVFFLLSFVLMLVSTTLVGLVDQALVGPLAERAPTAEEWLRTTLGVSVYVSLLGVLALAVGALLRHSAAAITVMLGVVLLPLVMSMFMYSNSLSDVREALIEYSVPSQLTALYGVHMMDGPSGWEPLLVIGVLTAAALGGAYAALSRRDA
ncbi:ABC transporter [Streptomyces mashuensis]|uniref:ABC transporter n=1 Tax=Streptomyces mashuensis TaxID=33904 RepID=A0A919B5T2_9ACTN|nr:ABC transporter permease [Streptomyces mashuensis]GHF50789.1 ABC transporter [Streptomyces mashuensis]